MILIIAVGQKQPAWVNDAFTDYAKRLPSDWAIELKEIKAEPRNTGKTSQQMMAAEAERIKAVLQREGAAGSVNLIALDERGRDLTTHQLSNFLQALKTKRPRITFVIGGPDGLDDALKTSCDHRVRLSSMTLPHALVRIILAEQLFRACSIERGHPYHRGAADYSR